ncbi:putative membrane protein YwzB [Polycladomyces abyssicola]|jgi:uncharacterized integral membrane protein (TIGR02327 family)|uniref:Putative membrane protein YwzB n=1 Tax=Polycladomyces abyssicola TaxID=1125966 RepID=A0A8D5UJB7_9BACL|nr:DUF1146 family protein [Polycladomyces abyssicola]BCU83244.1 putative membrane protein YwzB [Polycladomyces abyssicola]
MVDGATSLGVTALVNIILSLVSIAFSWWALTNLRLDVFMRQPKSVQAHALMILLSVVLGHGLASFLIDYMGWSRLISQMF